MLGAGIAVVVLGAAMLGAGGALLAYGANNFSFFSDEPFVPSGIALMTFGGVHLAVGIPLVVVGARQPPPVHGPMLDPMPPAAGARDRFVSLRWTF
jgi:hypothetical protein